MKTYIISVMAWIAIASTATADAQEITFNNEAADTTRITEILVQEAATPSPGNVTRIAELFTGVPYAPGTLERDNIETLRVNLDSLDCTTFVETVLALAYTAREHRQSWRDFAYNLRRLRYRNGETNGYSSRLHYVSDWIVDNIARGNIREITAEDNYNNMKSVEAGFSNHRYPYIKGSGLKSKHLAEIARDGDIVVFTTSIQGLDATHMGIIKIADGIPMLLHASSKAGKVLLDQLSVSEYIHRNRPEGIRLLRLTGK